MHIDVKIPGGAMNTTRTLARLGWEVGSDPEIQVAVVVYRRHHEIPSLPALRQLLTSVAPARAPSSPASSHSSTFVMEEEYRVQGDIEGVIDAGEELDGTAYGSGEGEDDYDTSTRGIVSLFGCCKYSIRRKAADPLNPDIQARRSSQPAILYTCFHLFGPSQNNIHIYVLSLLHQLSQFRLPSSEKRFPVLETVTVNRKIRPKKCHRIGVALHGYQL
ncbi:hypothetical protein BDP27DRAFT_1429507 [Rhodocollybia butyracea]|uniref:Uncharacterized protein n=1 Tax=Rhodocollybia butyracea TaxID=206335 RepID=A0A9P5PD02_9AGAR|nr:hypothetical protein BDP27DRAFT_1429507 [Rhodocollybia butyracea]